MTRSRSLGRAMLIGGLVATAVGVRPVNVEPVAAAAGLTGDCRAELAIGRNSGGNMRYRVDRFAAGIWSALVDDGGEGWGDSRGVTALAMGDVDGDGDDELAIGRNAGGNMRYQVMDESGGSWEQLHAGGHG